MVEKNSLCQCPKTIELTSFEEKELKSHLDQAQKTYNLNFSSTRGLWFESCPIQDF